MPEPNMLQYGSTENLKVVDKHINILFIDEPFETTLGCSSADIVSLIATENNNGLIHIKLHPRSDYKKYDIPSLDNVRFIDYIPLSIDKLYGFKSNLFSFIKCSRERHVYNVELKKFDLAPLKEKESFADGNYIDSVNNELNKFR